MSLTSGEPRTGLNVLTVASKTSKWQCRGLGRGPRLWSGRCEENYKSGRGRQGRTKGHIVTIQEKGEAKAAWEKQSRQWTGDAVLWCLCYTLDQAPNEDKLFKRLASSTWLHRRDNVHGKLHLERDGKQKWFQVKQNQLGVKMAKWQDC